ncbi:MAG: hypothetical protein ACOCX5_03330 [Chloroflexota bacterium]
MTLVEFFGLIAQTYPLDFMTRDVFDALIIAVIMIGTALAFLRLRADFTRPLPPADYDRPAWADDDTDPHHYVEDTDDQHIPG